MINGGPPTPTTYVTINCQPITTVTVVNYPVGVRPQLHFPAVPPAPPIVFDPPQLKIGNWPWPAPSRDKCRTLLRGRADREGAILFRRTCKRLPSSREIDSIGLPQAEETRLKLAVLQLIKEEEDAIDELNKALQAKIDSLKPIQITKITSEPRAMMVVGGHPYRSGMSFVETPPVTKETWIQRVFRKSLKLLDLFLM